MFNIKNHEVVADPKGPYKSYELALKDLISQEEKRLGELKSNLVQRQKKPDSIEILIACM